MEEKNYAADYIGIWKTNVIRSKRDFSLFKIWLNKSEDGQKSREGFSIDNLGKAKIWDFCLSKTKIKFIKQYDRDAENGRIITYDGVCVYFRDYIGEWDDGMSEGKFMLTAEMNSERLEKFLLEYEKQCFDYRIKTQREKFPQLPLNEIPF